MSPARPNPNAPRKEAFYVRVVLPDETSPFLPATDHIGRPMPFDKPRQTCAVRVHDDVVAFSLLHVTRKRAASLQGKPIEMPNSMLTRLTRRARELAPIEAGTVLVEHGEALHRCKLTVDAHRVASIETEEAEETGVELSIRGERLSLYFLSPVRERVLALGFIGHLGKPGTAETISRMASKVLNAAIALPAFQVLADVDSVEVPSKPGVVLAGPAIKYASLDFPVRLFADPTAAGQAPTPVSAGQATLEIDLVHANMATEGLTFRLVPTEAFAEVFAPYVRAATYCVAQEMRRAFGDELKSIVYDIALGEVEAATVERLQETLNQVLSGGIDLTPTRYVLSADPSRTVHEVLG